MFISITSKRVSAVVVAAALGLGLGGCAAEAGEAPVAGEESLGEVTAPLPLAAVSMTGATFGGGLIGAGGIGGVGGVGTETFGTGTSIGTGANIGTGTIGTSINTGSSFGTGPTGFSTSFGTGPIGSSTSFDTGPIGFSTSGGNTISRTISGGTGVAPSVISSCIGVGCP